MTSLAPADGFSSNSSPGSPGAARKGWALCLSGGGYRAALFHLGAVRRLNECGVLGRLDLVSSVSGGSILAAHLARVLSPWPQAGDVVAEWTQRVAAPFQAFCRVDIRTPALMASLLHPWRCLTEGLDPARLETAYHRLLTDARLSELPEHPRFVFCATEILTGTLWRFERDQISTWRTRRLKPGPEDTVARSVAASSCFPPLFAPMPPTREQGRIRDIILDDGRTLAASDLRLSDGGLYDNLGIQPAIKHHRVLLISDGGVPFDLVRSRGLLARNQRFVEVIGKQVANLRWREFHSLRNQGKILGGYWSLTGVESPEPRARGSYSREFAREVIATIRTDLNAFTPVEAGVLENHGYWQAESTLRKNAAKLQLPALPPAQSPQPDLHDENELRQALRDRQRRTPRGLLPLVRALWRGRNLPARPPGV